MKFFFHKITTEIKAYYKTYRRLDGANLAAALSFYTILSILPLAMILVAFLGNALGESEILSQKISELLGSTVPGLENIFTKQIHIIQKQRETIGIIGITFLFVTANFLFSHLEVILNRVLHVEKSRHFFMKRLLFFAWLVALASFLSLPTVLGVIQNFIHQKGFLWNIEFLTTGSLWFFNVSWLWFFVLMALLPRQRLPYTKVFLASLVFALLLIAARSIFHLYIQFSFNRFNIMYGSLATVVVGVLWIFYFFNVLIIVTLGLYRLVLNKKEPVKV